MRPLYPMKKEKELVARIKLDDRIGAKTILINWLERYCLRI